MLKRVSKPSLSISELAKPYDLSFTAIAKHVSVLEAAQLVTKERKGKERIVAAASKTIAIATKHLKQYEKMWNENFDRLETILANQ